MIIRLNDSKIFTFEILRLIFQHYLSTAPVSSMLNLNSMFHWFILFKLQLLSLQIPDQEYLVLLRKKPKFYMKLTLL